MENEKKIEELKTEEQPKTDAAKPSLSEAEDKPQTPDGADIPTAPLLSKAEVSVKDLTKLNETLTKRIEKLEASQKLTENEPKPAEKVEEKKDKYIPSIQQSEKPKTKINKGVVNGIFIG